MQLWNTQGVMRSPVDHSCGTSGAVPYQVVTVERWNRLRAYAIVENRVG